MGTIVIETIWVAVLIPLGLLLGTALLITVAALISGPFGAGPFWSNVCERIDRWSGPLHWMLEHF
jgi:hypothetical protein